MSFGVAQTGQLEISNSRIFDTITIEENCEKRDAVIADQLKPKPWWHFW
ncbi:MAG TPA: hypothetical protein VMT89_01940 [Candidatus Acidoferrales bacterium]|nr:hypothetical protein [Candidatus Acidoferrales bacterium]